MKENVNLYIRYGLLLLIAFLCYFVLRPYFATIVLALILAYMSFPLKRLLEKGIKNKNITAAIMTVLIFLVIVIPLFLLTNALIKEVAHIYTTINVEDIQTFFSSKLDIALSENIQSYLNDITKTATSYLLVKLSDFLFSIPELMIDFLILLFVYFFATRDGEKIIEKAKQLIPLEEHYKSRFEKKITSSIESLFYGTMIVATVESIVAIIGFYLLGSEAPILWGCLIGLTAVLPGIGATAVWAPMALVTYLEGNTRNAIIIALFGFLILSTLIDTIFRAKILGMHTENHPLIILIGVLGGITAFGFIGLFIGPLILALLELVLEIYMETKNEA